MPTNKKEGILQKGLLTYLNCKGYFWKNHTTGIYDQRKGIFRRLGQKGMSDILGVLKGGRFVAIEVKIKPNKPTADQLAFLQKVRNTGGIGIVAYSLDDVLEIIK